MYEITINGKEVENYGSAEEAMERAIALVDAGSEVAVYDDDRDASLYADECRHAFEGAVNDGSRMIGYTEGWFICGDVLNDERKRLGDDPIYDDDLVYWSEISSAYFGYVDPQGFGSWQEAVGRFFQA